MTVVDPPTAVYGFQSIGFNVNRVWFRDFSNKHFRGYPENSCSRISIWFYLYFINKDKKSYQDYRECRLKSVRDAIEKLSRENINMLEADSVFNFMFTKLDENQSATNLLATLK